MPGDRKAMPTRKTKRNSPNANKSSKPARININQLRKQIDSLKKKFEREKSKAGKVDQRSKEEGSADAESGREIVETNAAACDLSVGASGEGRRELARKQILAKIAAVRSELAERQADSSAARELSK